MLMDLDVKEYSEAYASNLMQYGLIAMWCVSNLMHRSAVAPVQLVLNNLLILDLC